MTTGTVTSLCALIMQTSSVWFVCLFVTTVLSSKNKVVFSQSSLVSVVGGILSSSSKTLFQVRFFFLVCLEVGGHAGSLSNWVSRGFLIFSRPRRRHTDTHTHTENTSRFNWSNRLPWLVEQNLKPRQRTHIHTTVMYSSGP